MKWVWVQTGLTLLLVAVVVWLALTALQANDALCTLRDDVQRRYDTGVQFLVDHPRGIPGISPADLQRSLENQRATLDALSDLRCL